MRDYQLQNQKDNKIKKDNLGNEKNKQTNKQTKKPRNLKVFLSKNWILKSSNILWFYFTNHIIHTRLNVLKPYDNYVAM